MKLPPWLAGLLIVVVLLALWWAVSDTGGDEEPAAGSPTPTATSTLVRTPTPTPSPTPSPSPAPEDTAYPQDEGDDWPEPTGTDTRDWDDIDACEDDILPATMIPVIEDIWAGGPYAYPDRDGTRFGNFEGYLPDEARSYYREFTVETPGLNHRGARRIVTGGPQESDPEVWYYTQDHYESFCEFAP